MAKKSSKSIFSIDKGSSSKQENNKKKERETLKRIVRKRERL